jgi:hypothetical protein
MAHEATLFFLNHLHDELAQYIDAVCEARQGGITLSERFLLSGLGMGFASQCVALCLAQSSEVLNDIPYVLRHMDMVLPDGTRFMREGEVPS